MYVCLIESQLKGVKKARNNSRCLVIIIYYLLNSEVLLNKSVCNYELRAFFFSHNTCNATHTIRNK